jgi:hypothetical protein
LRSVVLHIPNSFVHRPGRHLVGIQARNFRERVEQEKTRHEEILAQIKLDECLVRAHIVAIGIQLQAAAGTLDRAHALLNPIGGRSKARVDVQHFDDGLARRATNVDLELFTSECRSFLQTATAAGGGGTPAAGLWGLSRFSPCVHRRGHGVLAWSCCDKRWLGVVWRRISRRWRRWNGFGKHSPAGDGTAIAVAFSAVLFYREAG